MPSNTRRGNCGADRLDLQQAIRCNASVSSHTSLSCNGLKSVHDESAGFYHLPPGFRLPVQIILPGLTVQPVGLCLQSSAGWLDNHRFFFPGPLKNLSSLQQLEEEETKKKAPRTNREMLPGVSDEDFSECSAAVDRLHAWENCRRP